ncbi:MAG: hypothetical protein IKW78_03915, partial [Prevotella sp.]|nr:hypothetical protein [Prevotella sp.]
MAHDGRVELRLFLVVGEIRLCTDLETLDGVVHDFFVLFLVDALRPADYEDAAAVVVEIAALVVEVELVHHVREREFLGVAVADLDSAMSHPMALRQCDVFLRQHPNLNKVEHFDTAGSAREIAEKRLMGKAAICSELAADLYGLNILERGIETNKRNFTRFVVVADPLLASELGPSEAEINKSSIVFTLPHTQGALSKVLTILSFYDMNLSKIQSVPIIGREWEYRFYVNLTFD